MSAGGLCRGGSSFVKVSPQGVFSDRILNKFPKKITKFSVYILIMTCSSTPSLLLGLTLALTAPTFLSSCDTKAKEAALLAGEDVASLQKANSRLENDVKLLREQSETRHNELLKQNEELQKEADAA
jgi:outer membrane murein-binding lipoprotein Lpp